VNILFLLIVGRRLERWSAQSNKKEKKMGIREALLNKLGKGESGNQAINEFNGVRLIGTVKTVVENKALIETVNVGSDGQEYSEIHVVEGDFSKFEGKRVNIIGRLATVDTEDGRRETIIQAQVITKAKKGEPDQNIAKFVGNAARSFQYFPRTADGKMAFGNLLLVNGPEDKPQFVATKAFGHLANSLNRGAVRGSKVQVVGPIRYREYEQDGESRTALEIVAQPDLTKVLKVAKVEDPFAGVHMDNNQAADEPAV
jgi:hypothetical protein